MKNITEDDLLDFKLSLIPYILKAWNIDNTRFSQLATQYKLLPYIDISYEYYQYIGVEGIIEDLEEFIQEQGGKV